MSLIARLFQSASPQQASFLAAGTTLTGSLKGTGRLVVEGHLHGDASANEVIIAPGGSIEGDICAEMVQVAGRVAGAVQAGRLAIVGGGTFTGDALYESLEVADSAAFNARCRSIPSNVPATTPARQLAGAASTPKAALAPGGTALAT